MSDTFFEKSKEIANDFIQSIVFLDDRAYKGIDEAKPKNDFDVFKVSQVFAIEKKICAVYQPESEKDIEDFKIISQKADVLVLDWEINFPKIVSADNEEEDDDDEPRGIYTKQIIKNSVFDSQQAQKSLKLILVYTGDVSILESIVEEIHIEVFDSSDTYILNKHNCSIQSSEVKILVRAKKAEISNISNKEKYESKMVSYDELPSFILDEFTKMTSGLLSNFALMSLTTLRKNSSKILGLFSKEMDSAYLGHKAIIPKQEDAEDLLIELFGDSVKDLLFYFNINAKLREELIESWIEETIKEEEYKIEKNPFKRTIELTKDLLKSSEEDVKKRFDSLLGSSLSNKEKDTLINNSTYLYTNSENRNESESKDKMFSKLTHHKSLFIPKNIPPKLSLGTLVKSNKNDIYYICIQQKCDSIRIKSGNERKFLFIPLNVSEDKFDILTPDGIKLKKIKSSYAIRTIKFVCLDESGVISAIKEGDKFMFKQKYKEPEDEQFEWILDLKDLHSQRIIIEYTSQLSRVGLDESEWHRKNSI